ncbi:MAG: molybdopterin molybdotransferase MoeA [Alphaproteobacteria bacterium]|nr:molybdopterin molybdotransferase MoeA [Alphaproteobacteria bacterium]
MISVAEALERITSVFEPLAAEQIALAEGLGRVLAEDVVARVTQPPAAVSAMDGYAVRHADMSSLPTKLQLIGSAPAGGAFDGTVTPGTAVRIFTGGPVPDAADTIVIQEDTESDGETVTIAACGPAGDFVRPAGLDFRAGDVGLQSGRVLTARDIGFAAAMNVPWLRVRRRPRIAIMSSGDELVNPGELRGPNQIVSSNGISLAAFVTACGGTPSNLGIAADDERVLTAMAAGARGADLLVTSGGASVGDHDLVQKALGKEGLQVDFWKVAMRPGKPLIFGQLGETPLLGLPGNPVSSLVCAVVFLRPALAKMLGLGVDTAPAATAALGRDLPANDRRQDYLRATLSYDGAGEPVATPFTKQDSSVLSGLAHADCLIVRAPDAPSAASGDRVEVIHLSGSLFSV